jgi:hypothetical protein
LKHYQNKLLENLERILKMLYQRMQMMAFTSHINMDGSFLLIVKGRGHRWERSMWTAYTQPLFATLKAPFVHCYLAEIGFPALKIIYLT